MDALTAEQKAALEAAEARRSAAIDAALARYWDAYDASTNDFQKAVMRAGIPPMRASMWLADRALAALGEDEADG